MPEPTPLYRNLVLNHAIEEGCPEEVEKEAMLQAQARKAPGSLAYTDDDMRAAIAYAYTAGRVARWDALIKGSSRLMDAILAQVHEFFHEEPWPGHDGIALECPDCPTVSALAADAAAAYYSGRLLSDEGDMSEFDPEQETADILADPETMAALAEAERDIAEGNLVSIEEVRRNLYGHPVVLPPVDDDDDPTNPAFWQKTAAFDVVSRGALGHPDDLSFRVAEDGEVRHG